MTFSRITMAGVVASTPEKRFTPNNTAVTSFELQVVSPARGNSPATSYTMTVTCWARTAESVAESVKQGATVLVEGRLQAKTEAMADGMQKKTFEIDAQQVVVVNGELFNTGADQTIGGVDMPAPMPQPALAGAPAQQASMPMKPGGQPQASTPDYTDDDIPF